MFIFCHIHEMVKTFWTPSFCMHGLAGLSFPILSQDKTVTLNDANLKLCAI